MILSRFIPTRFNSPHGKRRGYRVPIEHDGTVIEFPAPARAYIKPENILHAAAEDRRKLYRFAVAEIERLAFKCPSDHKERHKLFSVLPEILLITAKSLSQTRPCKGESWHGTDQARLLTEAYSSPPKVPSLSGLPTHRNSWGNMESIPGILFLPPKSVLTGGCVVVRLKNSSDER